MPDINQALRMLLGAEYNSSHEEPTAYKECRSILITQEAQCRSKDPKFWGY
jgi:hypothetical protein